MAKAIVDGTYEIPPELDEATKHILKEIGDMGRKTKRGEGYDTSFTKENFQTFWRRVSEWTTSSMSTMHYGHYKAAAKNELASEVNAQQLTVIARSGVAPVRWGLSLQVLLEKLAGFIG